MENKGKLAAYGDKIKEELWDEPQDRQDDMDDMMKKYDLNCRELLTIYYAWREDLSISDIVDEIPACFNSETSSRDQLYGKIPNILNHQNKVLTRDRIQEMRKYVRVLSATKEL